MKSTYFRPRINLVSEINVIISLKALLNFIKITGTTRVYLVRNKGKGSTRIFLFKRKAL